MSELYNRISDLCQNHGISVGKMCNQLGISRGNLTELKKERIIFLEKKKAPYSPNRRSQRTM